MVEILLVQVTNQKEKINITQTNNCLTKWKTDHLYEKFFVSLQIQRVRVKLGDTQ